MNWLVDEDGCVWITLASGLLACTVDGQCCGPTEQGIIKESSVWGHLRIVCMSYVAT